MISVLMCNVVFQVLTVLLAVLKRLGGYFNSKTVDKMLRKYREISLPEIWKIVEFLKIEPVNRKV